MNNNIQKTYLEWLKNLNENNELKKELESMEKDSEAIKECFGNELKFGTGGLRGIIGVGTNRMNEHTVAKATQGYSNYLKRSIANPSVAIAYDSRIKSDIFAKIAARVFAANGIMVYLYTDLMPTPALSFAIRYLRCDGGIVITASHNPAKYNGYKVYNNNGGQITTKAAKEIQDEICNLNIFNDIMYLDFEKGIENKMIKYIDGQVISEYLQAVSQESLCPHNIEKDISIVYSPLNGSGLQCVTRVLRKNGFENIIIVDEQKDPDGNFPTCPYPNPEIREAMELGIEYAKKTKSNLVLATDPDCDRVGIAVKDGEDYKLLTGNEVGILLFDYICQRRIELNKMPKNPILCKTIVTIDLVEQIAKYYGVEVINVLTGFKYIGEQIHILEKNGEEERYIFGFEESYGYLSGGYVRDKDGVNAALLICEMFAYYKSMGKDLIDVLQGLYDKFGYCLNTLHSYYFEGIQGFEKMQNIMNKLRNTKINFIVDKVVTSIEDYQKQIIKYSNGTEKDIVGLPKSNVLKFWLDEGISIVIRPSGTEPKLKLYLSVNSENKKSAMEFEDILVKELEKIMNL